MSSSSIVNTGVSLHFSEVVLQRSLISPGVDREAIQRTSEAYT